MNMNQKIITHPQINKKKTKNNHFVCPECGNAINDNYRKQHKKGCQIASFNV